MASLEAFWMAAGPWCSGSRPPGGAAAVLMAVLSFRGQGRSPLACCLSGARCGGVDVLRVRLL
jgi:hypothetical protein